MLDFNHIYKVLATSILETLAPTRCVVCDLAGEVLCPTCASELPFIDLALACPRCAAPYGHVLCTECPLPGSEEALAHPEEAFPFAAARAALSFEAGAKKLVRAYKDADELRLDAVIASFMVAAMRGRSMRFAAHKRPAGSAMQENCVCGRKAGVAMQENCVYGRKAGVAMQENCVYGKIDAPNWQESPNLTIERRKKGGFGRYLKDKQPAIAKNMQRAEGADHQGQAKCAFRSSTAHPAALDDWTQWADAIVAVPASPEAVLRRGFDHMQRVALLCGQRTGLSVLDVLACKKGVQDQRELSRAERLANRRASFEVNDAVFSTGTGTVVNPRIILVDDVFTTGATLSAATEALLDAGAQEVRAVTCCRVW